MRCSFGVVFIILGLATQLQGLSAQPSPSDKKVVAVRTSEPIHIDGIFTESVWQRAGTTGFLQLEPVEGAQPTERTEVWVAYDDDAIYVAARMYDSAPDSIFAYLIRRDREVESDRFLLYLDPYHDRRTGYYFYVSAAGVKCDGVLFNDDWSDNSWDGVWDGKATIDSRGWTVEMRIPFSQIRFHKGDTQIWGVNFERDIARKNEEDYLVYRPKKESGFVSRFADLVGIERIPSPAQVEILPYANTRAEYSNRFAADPSKRGHDYLLGAGADLKVGLGSNLTLNGAINPDFGQVEVDPAVVNLTDVESYFDEKRQFFTEGIRLFNYFGYGGASSNWSFNSPYVEQFYSRRIGRAPQGSVSSGTEVNRPIGTRILGAAKVTGKLGDGWDVGTIHAVTAREYADLMKDNQRSRVEVEPPAYYGIVNAQKEFNGGAQALGVMSTLSERSFSEARLRDEMNSSALFTGLDGWTFLDDERVWVVNGWAGITSVAGTTRRMISLQRNSQHYFQRPDISHVRIDSSATTLTGTAMQLALNKQKGSVVFNAKFNFVNPKFEINDLGFQGRSDAIYMHAGGGYRWTDPTEHFRSASVNAAVAQTFDFGGNLTARGFYLMNHVQLLNYYELGLNFFYTAQSYNPTLTRGGPLVLYPQWIEVNGTFSTDQRASVVFGISGDIHRGANGAVHALAGALWWKPASNISLKVEPVWSHRINTAQWVTAVEDPPSVQTYGKRYVFGELDQTTLSADIRIEWTFTPDLSFQLYTQLLFSAGSYSKFKELARPRTFDFNVFGEGTSMLSKSDGVYGVDPDGLGPASIFTFRDPDFNIKPFRCNAVLRWEFRPGSTLYLVWTQTRSDFETIGDLQLGNSIDRLWGTRPDNIFMMKLSCWFNILRWCLK
jgi:hypothetical protein